MYANAYTRSVLRMCACYGLAGALFFVAGPFVAQGYSQTGYYTQSGYYSQGSYYSQSTYQTRFTDSVSVTGNVTVTGSLGKGSGTFVIDHPLDPENKLLYHSFVESPDVKNIYDGIATLDENGEAVIELPSYFEALNGEYRYQLEPIGAPNPDLHIQRGVVENRFIIGGGTPGGSVSWQVTGIRHDPYIRANPIRTEIDKGFGAPVERGEYIFEGYSDGTVTSTFAKTMWNRIRALFSDV